MTYEDGTVYEGERENGRPQGRGTLKFGAKGQFDGDFVAGRR